MVTSFHPTPLPPAPKIGAGEYYFCSFFDGMPPKQRSSVHPKTCINTPLPIFRGRGGGWGEFACHEF